MIKTAISVPEDLFKEIDRFARERKCSRSEVFVRASEQYLEGLKTREMLDALNAAYGEEETEDEKLLRQKSKERYRTSVLAKETY
jgi:metal-responsive CopG/Arc/MetJ family transcriptional regulator